MDGKGMKLVAFMEGSTKRFVIPVYQRNYDWKTENCKQLYDDLIKVIHGERNSHFFGSIVSVYDYNSSEDFFVIDGQQRLTTVSLLFLAMRNLIRGKIVVPKNLVLGELIYETYLVDKWQNEDTRIKLKSVKNDQIAFKKLFGEKKEYDMGSNLTINYNYFYDRIQKQELSVDELFEAIRRLEIINITLNPREDNPQMIFESLNSTGLALSEGDKIRNFILMGQPTKLQNEYYEKYWNKIEQYTHYEVSSFIRDYLSVKRQSIPPLNRVYAAFKEYAGDGKIKIEYLLKDMLSFADWYGVLVDGRTSDKQTDACICRLNRLETTVTRPFFLEILRLRSEGLLSTEEVREVFLCTESYLFRRTICNLPTNALNKIFLTLNREIMRFDGTGNNYVDKFKYALLSKKDRAKFPDDKDFVEAFQTCQVFLMKSKNKIYLLERFENFDTAEDKDIYSHVDDRAYSVEHIMPQSLTPQWMKELGENYGEIHGTWLHRIANLTLTAYNPNYSNRSFMEKKTMEHGFAQSGLRLNASYVAKQDKWGLSELEERNKLLMGQAVKIWKFPRTDYRPVKKQMDSFTLEDDISFTGRTIVRFAYRGQEQPVTSWIDMYEKVLRILHEEDKSVLSKYACTSSTDALSTVVSNSPPDLRGALRIDENIFVESNTSTDKKIDLLRKFFTKYEADPTDLVFYLKG